MFCLKQNTAFELRISVWSADVCSSDLNTSDGVSAVVGQGTNVAGHIATALLNLDLHFKLARVSQVCNDVVRVDDFNVVWQFDVAGQHNTGALLAQHRSAERRGGKGGVSA